MFKDLYVLINEDDLDISCVHELYNCILLDRWMHVHTAVCKIIICFSARFISKPWPY